MVKALQREVVMICEQKSPLERLVVIAIIAILAMLCLR
jgi:hypothetical protein